MDGANSKFTAQDLDIFARRFAELIDESQAENAIAAVRALTEGTDHMAHFSWGVPVRNYARHWGLGNSEEVLENHCGELLLASARLRLSSDFQPSPGLPRQTRPEEHELVGERRWYHFYGTAVQERFDTCIARLLALYDTGWYCFANVQILDDAIHPTDILEAGRYEEGDRWMGFTATEVEGEPLPTGGSPFIVTVESNGMFMYGDMEFNREEAFLG